MKTILLSVVALGAMSGVAIAEPAKMNLGQLDQVAGGVELPEVGSMDVTGIQDPTATTDLASIDGKGGKGCGCWPSLDLAVGNEESFAFTKDSGASVHYGTGPGLATTFTKSVAFADSFVNTFAGGL